MSHTLTPAQNTLKHATELLKKHANAQDETTSDGLHYGDMVADVADNVAKVAAKLDDVADLMGRVRCVLIRMRNPATQYASQLLSHDEFSMLEKALNKVEE
jgi:hypothetical protein